MTSSRIPGETHPVRRLLPDDAETTVAEQLAELDLQGAGAPRPPVSDPQLRHHPRRPRRDRRARSGAIGSDTDTEMLQRLRTRVDAVMIGAGTMRAERYGRIVSDPRLPRLPRAAPGSPTIRSAVIVSNRLELPWDAGLFTDGGGRVVIFTASEQEPPETATPVTVVRHPDGVDLDRALEWLLRGARHPLRPLRRRAHPARPAARGPADRRALPDDRAEDRGRRGPADPGGRAARRRPGRARLAARVRRASSSPAIAGWRRFQTVDFKPSPEVESLLRAHRGVHGRARLPGRGRGDARRSTTRSSPGSPYPEILVEIRARGQGAGPLEPLPSRTTSTAPA